MSGTKPQADVEMVVTSQQALAALDAFGNRFNAMLDKMEQGNKRVKKTTQDSGEAFAQWGIGLGKAASSAIGFFGVLQSIQTIAGLVRREIEAVTQAQKEAAGTTMSFNDAMDQIRFQTNQSGAAAQGMGFNQIRNRIRESSFPDKTVLANVVRSAISADADSPYATRVQTAIDVAELRPDLRHNPEVLQSLTRAVLLNKRLHGGSTKEQLGMIDIGISASAVDNAQAFAEYINPLGSDLLPLGFSQKESFAIASAYGLVSSDSHGPITRSNIGTVFSQLYSEIVKRGGNEKGMNMIKLIQENSPRGKELRDFMLGVLQQEMTDEEKRQASEFGDGSMMGFMRGKLPMMNLFQMQGVGEFEGSFKKALEATMNEIPSIPEAGRLFDEKLAERAADPEFMINRLDVALQNFGKSRELDPNVGIRDVAIGFIDKISKKTNDYDLKARLSTFVKRIRSGDMLPGDALGMVQGLAESRASQIERYDNFGLGTPRRQLGTGPMAFPMNAEEQRQVSDLKLLASEVSKLVEQLKENQRTAQPVVDTTPKLKEPAPPAAGGISNQ